MALAERNVISAGDAVFAFASMLTALPHVVPFGTSAWATPGADLAGAFNRANGLEVSVDFPAGLVFPKIEGGLLETVRQASQPAAAPATYFPLTLRGLIAYGQVAADPSQGAATNHMRYLIEQMVPHLKRLDEIESSTSAAQEAVGYVHGEPQFGNAGRKVGVLTCDVPEGAKLYAAIAKATKGSALNTKLYG